MDAFRKSFVARVISDVFDTISSGVCRQGRDAEILRELSAFRTNFGGREMSLHTVFQESVAVYEKAIGACESLKNTSVVDRNELRSHVVDLCDGLVQEASAAQHLKGVEQNGIDRTIISGSLTVAIITLRVFSPPLSEFDRRFDTLVIQSSKQGEMDTAFLHKQIWRVIRSSSSASVVLLPALWLSDRLRFALDALEIVQEIREKLTNSTEAIEQLSHGELRIVSISIVLLALSAAQELPEKGFVWTSLGPLLADQRIRSFLERAENEILQLGTDTEAAYAQSLIKGHANANLSRENTNRAPRAEKPGENGAGARAPKPLDDVALASNHIPPHLDPSAPDAGASLVMDDALAFLTALRLALHTEWVDITPPHRRGAAAAVASARVLAIGAPRTSLWLAIRAIEIARDDLEESSNRPASSPRQQRGSAIGVLRGEAELLAGISLYRLGEYAVSIQRLERAQEEESVAAQALRWQSECYFAMGKTPKAGDAAQKSIALCQTKGDVVEESRSLLCLANSQVQARRIREAISTYEDGLVGAKISGDPTFHALALFRLGHALRLAGRTPKAVEKYKAAMEIFQSGRTRADRRGLASCLSHLAMCRAQLGERSVALALFRDAALLHCEAKHVRGAAACLLGIASLEYQNKDTAKALDTLKRCMMICSSEQNADIRETATQRESHIRHQMGVRRERRDRERELMLARENSPVLTAPKPSITPREDLKRAEHDAQTDVKSRIVVWERDHRVLRCRQCSAEFSFWLRRHHCRNCGKIFCYACTEKRTVVPGIGIDEPVRVCDGCFESLVLSTIPKISKEAVLRRLQQTRSGTRTDNERSYVVSEILQTLTADSSDSEAPGHSATQQPQLHSGRDVFRSDSDTDSLATPTTASPIPFGDVEDGFSAQSEPVPTSIAEWTDIAL